MPEKLSRILRTSKRPQAPSTGRWLRAIDLFAGCGGLSLGVMQATYKKGRRLKIDLAVDSNADALSVYADNFSSIAKDIVLSDVSELIDSSKLGAALTRAEKSALKPYAGADIVVAGPPCQGHSNLNNTSRRSDPRNILYIVPVRAALALRPKVVLIENVPSVSHSLEQISQLSRRILLDLGYCVQEMTVELSKLGVPQRRKRHLLVASLHEFDLDAELKKRFVRNEPALLDFIRDLEGEHLTSPAKPYVQVPKTSVKNQERIDYLFDNNVYDLPNGLRPACHRDKVHSYVSMYGRMFPDRPAQTITSGFGSMGQGRFVHPTQRRMITAHEAARVQGFPDYFSFSSASGMTALREMIGNAVPPTLAEVVTSILIDRGIV